MILDRETKEVEVEGGQALRGQCLLLLHFAQHLRGFTLSGSRSCCLKGTSGLNTVLGVRGKITLELRHSAGGHE